jgi:hypothetical protein
MTSGVGDNVISLVMLLTRDGNMTAIVDDNVSNIFMYLTQNIRSRLL